MLTRLSLLFALIALCWAVLTTTSIHAQDTAAGATAEQAPEIQQPVQKKQSNRDRGNRRRDLQRFVGLYGDPSGEQRGRQLFVTVSCDGYLVVGPKWADVSPWWMRSAGDTVFTYTDSFISLSLEFTVREDGEVESLAHDLKSLVSPLGRVGPLPDEMEGCVKRSWP